MVVGENYKSNDRPTLQNYLKTLEGGGKSILKSLSDSPQYEDPDLIRMARATSNSTRNVQVYADMLAEANPRVSEKDILAQAKAADNYPNF